MLKIHINNKQDIKVMSESDLELTIAGIFKTAELDLAGELSVTLVDDEEMTGLNSQFRGKDSTTDVLCFPQDEGVEMPIPDDPDFLPLLGDIIISVPAASRQAEELGHSLEKEIKILLIHAILHLSGYDHDNIYQETFMKEEEKAILTALEEMERVTS